MGPFSSDERAAERTGKVAAPGLPDGIVQVFLVGEVMDVADDEEVVEDGLGEFWAARRELFGV